MHRFILVFIAVFVGVFGMGYFLMPAGSRPVSSPPTAAVRPADDDDDLPKKAEEKPAPSTPASEPDDAKLRSAKLAADVAAKARDVEKQLNKSAPTPKTAEKPASKPDRSKRIVVKRSPATPKLEAPKPEETAGGGANEDLDRLQGTWRMVAAEYSGERQEMTEEARQYTWEFQGDKYTIKLRGKFEELWKVQLYSSRDPKTIDGTHDITRKKLKGIYELTGDTLKVCYDLTGNTRPNSFKTAKGSRWVSYYLKR
jgi:uncharacterized protein (TIGR03067 family)